MNILIADDHSIVRRGIRDILQDAFESATIQEVCDAETLLAKALGQRWDVIVTDVSMPGRSGLEALRQIRVSCPKVPVIVLSIHPEEQYAIRALKAGASGYLNKEAAPEELVGAVQKVLTGKKYLSPVTADKLFDTLHINSNQPLHLQLSDREFEVMKLLAQGKSPTSIATALSISITTVSTYRSRILEKMGLTTNAEIIRYALEAGLV